MFTSHTSQCESEMDSENLVMIESMLCKEITMYAQHDYFSPSIPIAPATPNSSSNPVDQSCRSIMAKWCISLCKFCSYDRRMVASIMSCVDRFVSTPKGSRILLDRNKYQLAVMASLYLTAKVQQTQALEPESIAKLSRGKYKKADIESMELEILTSLKWFVNPPTPMGFAHEFLENFDFVPEGDNGVSVDDSESDELSFSSSSTSTTKERIIELVNCQIEEAACDYELSCLTRPSHVAFGAFSNALQSLNIYSSDLDSMRMLKDRLEIIDDADGDSIVSAALLRVVSSSESSNNSLSSLLLHGSNEQRKRTRSISRSHKVEQWSIDNSFSRVSSSSIHSSPRTVVEGIL